MANPLLYRKFDYVGGRILQSRELNTQQGLELVRDLQSLGSLYREGATLNVEVQVNGADVDLVPVDVGKPMLIFVRGTFEPFTAATLSYDPGKTSGFDFVYLNWELLIRTDADDPTLIDVSTGEPTARAGELVIDISETDTSGTALNPSTQLEKNTTPIVVFTLERGPGGSIDVQYTDNVEPEALSDGKNAGLVRLSTLTGAGIAASNDDARLSDARAPLDQSVTTSKVKDLIQTGLNGDGSPQFDPATPGQGGVTTLKLIYDTLKTSVTWILDNIRSRLTTVETDLSLHLTTRLGSPGSHPLPTPQEIGAAPASHVGQNLGRSDTHPPVVNDDVSGFEVVRPGQVAASKTNYAVQVREGLQTKAGLTHDGDVFSLIAQSEVATPLEGGLAAGPLAHIGLIAKVLAEHVNSYPNKNPHGLAPADIGAAEQVYVDTQDAGVLGSSIGFTELMSGVAVRTANFSGSSGSYPPGTPLSIISPPSQATMKHFIFTFGNRFEIAIGFGQFQHGMQVPLPEVTGWLVAQWMAHASPGWALVEYDQDSQAAWNFRVDPSSRIVTARERSLKKGDRQFQWANVTAFAWRSISPPPIIISFTPTQESVGQDVTIIGRNFGLAPDVFFNGVPAAVVTSGPTQIVATVPIGATTGPISVTDPATGKTGISASLFTVI